MKMMCEKYIPKPKPLQNEKGWSDAFGIKPEPYDIHLLKTDKGKEIPGWWTGTNWDGLKIHHKDKIIAFKRMYNHMYVYDPVNLNKHE